MSVPDIHRSAKRQEIAAQNAGFREGVCHVIDELRVMAAEMRDSGLIGGRYDHVADELERRLFAPRSTPP